MSKVNELRTKRAKTWEQAKAFLDSHRGENGILSAEDTETYERMEQEIVDLGREIERQERLDAMGREMEAPLMAPLTAKPEGRKKDEKTGTASDAYRDAFWNQVRSRNGISYEIRNALSEGVDSEGGYLVPDEFERTLVQALEEDNVIRAHAHVFTTSNGIHKIPVVATMKVPPTARVMMSSHRSRSMRIRLEPLSRYLRNFSMTLRSIFSPIFPKSLLAASEQKKRKHSLLVTEARSLPVFCTQRPAQRSV